MEKELKEMIIKVGNELKDNEELLKKVALANAKQNLGMEGEEYNFFHIDNHEHYETDDIEEEPIVYYYFGVNTRGIAKFLEVEHNIVLERANKRFAETYEDASGEAQLICYSFESYVLNGYLFLEDEEINKKEMKLFINFQKLQKEYETQKNILKETVKLSKEY